MDIIITGAGKGIGYELAKVFSIRSDIRLFLISRSHENLNQLKKECLKINGLNQVHMIPFDLEQIITEEKYPIIESDHIDILINNAGCLINKSFSELDNWDIYKMMNVNFIAPIQLIRKFISKMGGESNTHIVNIGSMGGFQGSLKYPGLSVYSASKAALAALTECLAVELINRNIICNCLALGAVQTEMLNIAFPGYKAPLNADEMAQFIAEFALNGHKYFNGKILPVALAAI
jgi:short-subunit dehydrogenase